MSTTEPVPVSAAEQTRLALRRQRAVLLSIRVAAVAAILYAVAAFASPWYRLTVSVTHSLPSHLWVVAVGRLPQRGDYVAFRIPANRFYPSDHGGFLKIARGVAGDQVVRRGQEFFVNGESIGLAKTVSLNGLPLEPGPVGVIPPGEWFVWTPDIDSYDSRYADIGWVRQDQIVGVARPVL
ncbi:MAG: S26 family signal peptidase [Nevskia sp.]|nr:S26 family signal peptidase [Nevskia sp.]